MIRKGKIMKKRAILLLLFCISLQAMDQPSKEQALYKDCLRYILSCDTKKRAELQTLLKHYRKSYEDPHESFYNNKNTPENLRTLAKNFEVNLKHGDFYYFLFCMEQNFKDNDYWFKAWDEQQEQKNQNNMHYSLTNDHYYNTLWENCLTGCGKCAMIGTEDEIIESYKKIYEQKKFILNLNPKNELVNSHFMHIIYENYKLMNYQSDYYKKLVEMNLDMANQKDLSQWQEQAEKEISAIVLYQLSNFKEKKFLLNSFEKYLESQKKEKAVL